MQLSDAERFVLRHFAEKSHTAGGPRPGFLLRKRAILRSGDTRSGIDLAGGLGSLVDKGLIKANEAGDRFALTAAGVEWLRSATGL